MISHSDEYLQSSDRTIAEFEKLVQSVAERVGAPDVNASVVTVFKTHYATVFKRVKENSSVEVIRQGGEPFVLLSASQLFTLMESSKRTPTAAELLVGLPAVSMEEGPPPRVRSVLSKSHHRVPR